jgi:hypothetical protein
LHPALSAAKGLAWEAAKQITVSVIDVHTFGAASVAIATFNTASTLKAAFEKPSSKSFVDVISDIFSD